MTARNGSKACAARAASLFFTIRAIKLLICGVEVAIPVVDANRLEKDEFMLMRGNGEQVLAFNNAILVNSTLGQSC